MTETVQLRIWNLELGGSRAELSKLAFVALELTVLLLAVRAFGIQDSAFRYTLALAVPGFVIHALLPSAYRLSFFVALSLVAAVLVLGPSGALWLAGLGGLLVGVCYAPVSLGVRAACLALLGAVFAAARAGMIELPVPDFVWPVLASMFMFRLIVFLYDAAHEPARPPLTRALAYFFMLPNVCFPLFPVVDYKKFSRSSRSGPQAYVVYQRGVQWMFRGIVHLLLYRFVYQNLALDPATAAGFWQAVQFSFSAFLLYLQVSGLFHLIVGMLLLFGFDLPETHHRYYLASSFNDFWRRINIYWKDFMMKLFYYPVYFRVRRFGDTAAIVVSTLAVFFATWLLHAYQWFWLRGSMLIEWNDSLFWAILGLLVVANSLYEHRFGRRRAAAGQAAGWWGRLSVAMSTAATFLTIGLLWGMWSSDDLQQWTMLWSGTDGAWRVFTVVIPALYAASLLLQHLDRRRQPARDRPLVRPAAASPGFWRPASATLIGILALTSIAQEPVRTALPALLADAVNDVTTTRLNARDEGQMIRGYYEELVAVNRHMGAVWQMSAAKPDDWGEESVPDAKVLTGDLRVFEHRPNLAFTLNGAAVTTNAWGMRDRDYALEKPAGTQRLAALGASYVFGMGVADDEVFTTLVEKHLNAPENSANGPVELLNFGGLGSGPVRQVGVLEQRVVSFAPDVLLVFGHRADPNRALVDLDLALESNVSLGYPELEAIARQAGWNASEAPHLRRQRLARYRFELLDWAYRRMAEICREHGIRPVYVYLPFAGDDGSVPIPDEVLASPRRAGFAVLTDLRDVFAGQDHSRISIAPWDGHPNSLGHRLIADRLFQVLENHVLRPASATGDRAEQGGAAN